jgi:lipoprotein NlpI
VEKNASPVDDLVHAEKLMSASGTQRTCLPADRLCKEQKYKEVARSQAMVRHAQALRAKGEIDAAIDKLRKAIELDKANALAKKDLGVAFLLNGQHVEAVTSLEQSITAAGYNPPYTTIWLYLAQAKSGEADAKFLARNDLQRRSLTLKKNKWPYPVVWMFLGDLQPAGVLASAGYEDQKCDAYFHIGQWYLLQGKRERAIECFHSVELKKCPRYYTETIGSKLELKNLQAPRTSIAAKCT